MSSTRDEYDSLGKKTVPNENYYGILYGDLFNDFCWNVLAALLLGADVEVEAVFQL